MFEKVAPFTIYDPYVEAEDKVIFNCVTDYEILTIPNGRLYTNNIDHIAIITADNRLVERVSWQYKVDARTTGRDNRIFSQKFFIKPQYIDGTVFSMLAGYGPTTNIAHWFFDSIPRIHLLKQSGLFDSIDYFLVPAFRLDYHRDSLVQLGVDPAKIIAGKEDTHIIARNLVVSSHPRGERSFLLPRWLSEFLRTSFPVEVGNDDRYPKRIYVSRKDSSLRKVSNEDALEQAIAPYGFQTVLLSKYSLMEKIKLFGNADVIISSTGAGLTCLFFCKKDSTVIELFPPGFVNTHYFNIAYHQGMNHFPVICKSKKLSRNAEEGQLEDLYVDVEELTNLVKQIF